MRVETVTLWKACKPCDFNATEKADLIAQGWTETPEAVKPVDVPKPAKQKGVKS